MTFRCTVALAGLLFAVTAPLGAAAQVQGPIQAAQLTGSWKNPANGSCNPAYFKGGEATKTIRGEDALGATVVDKGVTVNGIVILRGAREGQMVNATSDKAIFLIDILPDKKLKMIPIGEPVLAWQELTLDAC